MKKLLLWLLILGNMWIVMASLPSSDFVDIISSYISQKNDSETRSLNEYPNYKPCKEFTEMQRKYQMVYDLGFLRDLGNWITYRNWKFVSNDYPKYRSFFAELASFTPKNFVQQSLFPYGNSIHAESWLWTQLFCWNEKNNFYQMGTLRLEGHIVLQNIEIARKDENTLTTTAQEIYFVISESKDPNIENLPYLQTIGGRKAIFLWCFSEEENAKYLENSYIGNLGTLSVNIDAVHNAYNIGSVRYNSWVQQLFKKSATSPEKKITINAQLTPNVIFDHGLNIPCENSWIQDIEIIAPPKK